MNGKPIKTFLVTGPDSQGLVLLYKVFFPEGGPHGSLTMSRASREDDEIVRLAAVDQFGKDTTVKVGLEAMLTALTRLYPDVDFSDMAQRIRTEEMEDLGKSPN